MISKVINKQYYFDMSMEDYQMFEEDYIGLCIYCGEERSMCEPDARNYTCESCEQKQVFGVPELLQMGHVTISEDE